MNKTKTLLVAAALATAASLSFAQADPAAPMDTKPKATSTAKKPAHSTAKPAHAKTAHHTSDAKHSTKTAEPATPTK